jgi:hypothetical protein
VLWVECKEIIQQCGRIGYPCACTHTHTHTHTQWSKQFTGEENARTNPGTQLEGYTHTESAKTKGGFRKE